jgi:cysteine-rich repeat protein
MLIKQYRGVGLAAILGIVGTVAVSACSDSFSSCKETRTCRPVGGAPSEGGEPALEAGAGGAMSVADETSGGDTSGGGEPNAIGSAGETSGQGGSSPFCGDGVVEDGTEECDDNNATSGDGCSKACTVEPVQIVGLSNKICALGSNGQIRCFAPDEKDWAYFDVALDDDEKATSIAGGAYNLCAVVGGNARCWGTNQFGELGSGNTMARGVSTLAPNIDLGSGAVVTSIAVSGMHACASLANGTVKCWGSNQSGELGVPKNVNNPSIGDSADEMGDNLPAVSVTADSNFVVVGNYFSCAKRVDGTVRCWGAGIGGTYTSAGNLDLGTPLTVQHLSAAASHACALLTSNNIKCWGNNNYGQLGQGDMAKRGPSPTMGNNLLPIDLGAGKSALWVVTTGNSASCAVLNDGSAKCWGRNDIGQLGTGDTLNVGDEAGDMAALNPLSLGTGRRAKQLAAAQNTTCALLDDASIACWGVTTTAQQSVIGDEPDEMGDKLPIVTLKF